MADEKGYNGIGDEESAGSFLDFGSEDYSETPDVTTVPEGEYQVEMVGLRLGTGKESGKPYLMANLEVVGNPNAGTIYHLMMLPNPDDKPKTQGNRKRAIKYFSQAFGIPTSGRVNFEEYLGRQAYAFLREEEDDRSQLGKRNTVGRWVIGA